MKSFLPFLFTCLLLVGCAKKESEIPEPEEPEKLCYVQNVEMSTIYPSGWELPMEETYTYLTKGRLYSQIAILEKNVAYGSTFAYDANGRITRENSFGQYREPLSYYSYEYDQEGKLTTFYYHSYNPQTKKYSLESKSVCEYIDAKQLKTMRTYSLAGGKEVLTNVTEYVYTNGLMTKATRYDSNKKLESETTLTYDDKKNIVSTLPAYRAIMVTNGFPHEYNVKSLIRTDAEGKVNNYFSYNKTFTYTERGYVESVTANYLDGRVEKSTYTYDCD